MARLLKLWDNVKSEYVESQEISDFVQDIINVYEKHGFSLSHEDTHGAFIIEQNSENNIEWLRNANIGVPLS